jgi:hypothetical protein
MTPDIFFGKDDTAPALSEQLLAPGGTPFDLTGATVVFRFRLIDQSGAQVSQAATIVGDHTQGNVAWQPAAPLPPGLYHANWVATLAGGAVITVPNDRWLIMKVLEGP